MLGLSKRGAVVLLVALAVVVAGAIPVLGASKATKAPAGVWAGNGDQDGDYSVLAIAKGPAGKQQTFYVEELGGGCGEDPVILYGTSSYDGGVLTFTTSILCGGSGVAGPSASGQTFELTFVQDPGNDTWLQESFGDETPGVMTRRCVDNEDTAGEVTHEGTAGDDVLTGTEGNDVMDGKGGNDKLIGLGGIDILCGQGGKDILKGGAGADILLGGGGNDKMIGGPGWDFGTGSGGKDVMKGNGGTDVLLGEAKPDKIYGGAGPNDVAIGGGGADTCRAEIKKSC